MALHNRADPPIPIIRPGLNLNIIVGYDWLRAHGPAFLYDSDEHCLCAERGCTSGSSIRLTLDAQASPATRLSPAAAHTLLGSLGLGDAPTLGSRRSGRPPLAARMPFHQAFWTALHAVLGPSESLIFGSPHHNNNTSKVERVNCVTADVLRAFAGERGDNWPEFMPLAEFAIKDSASPLGSGYTVTPFYVESGQHPRRRLTPPDALDPRPPPGPARLPST